ncbi:MAG: archease, partial [Archaeoglobaceae archaeon]
MKYRFIDHTADIAFEVYGKDLKELLVNAALAFYEAFVKVEKIKGEDKKFVEVEAEDEDLLLYKWLNELLFLFETQFFAGKEVRVELDGLKAKGEIIGGKFSRDAVKVEPKAITMHKFGIRKEKDGLAAFI